MSAVVLSALSMSRLALAALLRPVIYRASPAGETAAFPSRFNVPEVKVAI